MSSTEIQEAPREPIASESGSGPVAGPGSTKKVQQLELDLRAARIAQLQDELESAYGKIAELREQLLVRDSYYSPCEAAALVQRLFDWRSGAHKPGRREGISILARSHTETSATVAQMVQEFSSSEWFDGDWYVNAYPRVQAMRIGPVEHYIRYGASEGKDPSSRFSTLGYLVRNPDVVKSGMNPLSHYLRYGLSEGRSPGGESQGVIGS